MANTTLSQQVQKLREEGKTKEEIYKELLVQGETIDAITQAFGQSAHETHPEDTQKKND